MASLNGDPPSGAAPPAGPGRSQPPGPPEPVAELTTLPRAWPSIPEAGALVAVLVGLVVLFSLTSPYFLSYLNLINIATAVAVITIVAAPGTILLIAGQFDLSVGAGVAFVGVVMAWAAPEFGLPLAVVAAMLAALGIGLFNGLGVTFVGVNALVTTLASLAILRGLAKVVSDGQTLLLRDFGTLGTSQAVLRYPASGHHRRR